MDCKKLFECIDELYPKYVEKWVEICNMETPTMHKELIDKLGNYFIDMAKARGWHIHVLEHEVAGNAITITLNPDAKAAPVALSGHIDTVHPIGLFPTPAVSFDEENIYGPGVEDCKGGVVASFLAMDALDRCGFRNRPVKLIIQSDEETSSITSGHETIRYMCDQAKDAVAFLNTEGMTKGSITVARKGIIRFELTVHGVAGHSSKCYKAANAITEAAHKIIELEKLKDKEGITCNCGVIKGGSVANSVAETCSFTADIRFSDAQQLEWAKNKIKEVAESSTVSGCWCEVRQVSMRPAMEDVPANYQLAAKINEINERVELPVLKTIRTLGGADSAYTTQAGIPTVDGVGVIGDLIHSRNEFAVKSSLAYSAKQQAAVVCFI